MDLVYMNSSKEDVGVLKDYTMDLAYGFDENNFECKIDSDDHCCDAGYFLYFEDTEYGGIVDEIEVNTEAQEVTYLGRTWHGILNSKILEPDADQDYLICNGEANEVIDTLISRMGLDAFFSASNEDSGININSYKMNRYIGGYDGIKKMLKSVGAKLIIKFADGYAVLSAEEIVDYSEIREMTDDTMNFTIKKNFMPINHVICLGSGDLKDRRVIHLFCDANGNISGTQSFTGINEMTAVYDYPNAESDEELIKGGVDIIAESRQSLQVDFSFASDDESIDIGDKISATERISAIAITVAIAKKIVNIHNGLTDIAYECEGFTGSVASSGYPSSGGGGTENIDAINVIFDNAGTTYTSENVQDALEEVDTKKLPLTGGTITGLLNIKPTQGQWCEGIRIKPYQTWTTILLAGEDLTADSGTSPNSWSLHNCNGSFYLSRNGSNAASTHLSCVNNIWKANGNELITVKGTSGTITNGEIRSGDVTYKTRGGICMVCINNVLLTNAGLSRTICSGLPINRNNGTSVWYIFDDINSQNYLGCIFMNSGETVLRAHVNSNWTSVSGYLTFSYFTDL